MTTTCHFCGDPIDQKTALCMADDISHRLCREAGKAVSKEDRDAEAARIATFRRLPWVAWRTRSGEWSLSMWEGRTRNVVLVGCRVRLPTLRYSSRGDCLRDPDGEDRRVGRRRIWWHHRDRV